MNDINHRTFRLSQLEAGDVFINADIVGGRSPNQQGIYIDDEDEFVRKHIFLVVRKQITSEVFENSNGTISVQTNIKITARHMYPIFREAFNVFEFVGNKYGSPYYYKVCPKISFTVKR